MRIIAAAAAATAAASTAVPTATATTSNFWHVWWPRSWPWRPWRRPPWSAAATATAPLFVWGKRKLHESSKFVRSMLIGQLDKRALCVQNVRRRAWHSARRGSERNQSTERPPRRKLNGTAIRFQTKDSKRCTAPPLHRWQPKGS
jgi:hypothetical protein